jgi:hypothetical protein
VVAIVYSSHDKESLDGGLDGVSEHRFQLQMKNLGGCGKHAKKCDVDSKCVAIFMAGGLFLRVHFILFGMRFSSCLILLP